MFVDTLMLSLSNLRTEQDQDQDPWCFWRDIQRPRAYSPWSRSREQYCAPKRGVKKRQTSSPDLSPLHDLEMADMALLFESILTEYRLTGDYTKSPSTEGSSSPLSPLGNAEVAALFGLVSAGNRAWHRYVGQHTPTLVRV